MHGQMNINFTNEINDMQSRIKSYILNHPFVCHAEKEQRLVFLLKKSTTKQAYKRTPRYKIFLKYYILAKWKLSGCTEPKVSWSCMNTLNRDPDQDWNWIFEERNSTAFLL